MKTFKPSDVYLYSLEREDLYDSSEIGLLSLIRDFVTCDFVTLRCSHKCGK